MKISNLNNNHSINFNCRIIDAHVHCGNLPQNGTLHNSTPDIDTFIKQPLPNGDTVEKIVVSNLDCMISPNSKAENMGFISDEIKGNEDLLKLAEKNPKIIPLATGQPKYGNVENLKTLFKKHPNKFAGIKLHPEQLKLEADNPMFDAYLNFAAKKKIPCLIHSASSFPVRYPDGYTTNASQFSRPEQIYALAKRHKSVPVIMAHLGGNEGENTRKAVDLILESIHKKDAMLYGDISWVDCDNSHKNTILEAIERLKKANALDRLMFGTDAPIGRFGGNGENGIAPIKAYTDNINNIKNAIRNKFGNEADSIIDKLFYQNAENLFINNKKNINKLSKRVKVIAGVALLGIIAISSAIYCKNQIKNNNNSITPMKLPFNK